MVKQIFMKHIFYILHDIFSENLHDVALYFKIIENIS